MEIVSHAPFIRLFSKHQLNTNPRFDTILYILSIETETRKKKEACANGGIDKSEKRDKDTRGGVSNFQYSLKA